MSDEAVNQLMAITDAQSAELAQQFLDMAGGDLETAISLFFEHGGNAQINNGRVTSTDAELAGSLQNELYSGRGDDYRTPDEARHETLVDTHVLPTTFGGVGGSFGPLRGVRSMYDSSRPEGVFNQHMQEREDSEFSEEEQYQQEYEYVEETVVELDEDGQVREVTELVRRPKPLTKEQKLAILFRPPFNLMAKVDLDGAKERARVQKKWIMINIQAVDIFQCQALNRDLWSDKEVAKIIKQNFLFLQYQYDSSSATSYVQFYGLHNRDNLPHIAILDPMTGERLVQWNREVPEVDAFIARVQSFLSDFSLDAPSHNPLVRHPTPQPDPTTLSEEQQMEIAIKQSLGASDSNEECRPNDKRDDDSLTSHNDTQVAHSDSIDEDLDLFLRIKPVSHPEPANEPGKTTRIQIRTGDGRRLVRRFLPTHDTVQTIYEVVKSELDGFETDVFTISDHNRENLIAKLSQTIEEAGLKNSSLLLEKVQE
ncbi:LAMI_0C04258g1_1 [Lachancea mirantina]|uniref:LAMI_0C04258g1_1 n=1 Tax=Lachancea mirantina TaxID=1230905 RepID=A0A1G4J2V0_9SACH|nr:LAMI_0C04258g1_1 [Lachancea mirantina]